MEQSKYYTPELEELHFGFEFEYKHPLSSGTENSFQEHNWSNKLAVLSINNEYVSIGGYVIKPENIRVKYLDREDIEECGWELNNTKDWWELGNLFPKESYKEGDHYLGNWKYRISLNSSKSNWYHIDTRNTMNGGQLQIFRGVIKNKSELKRLMKQLGIYEQHNK